MASKFIMLSDDDCTVVRLDSIIWAYLDMRTSNRNVLMVRINNDVTLNVDYKKDIAKAKKDLLRISKEGVCDEEETN